MATSNCPGFGPRGSLGRDDLIPLPVTHARVAFKIALGALIGVLLAIAGSIPPEKIPQSGERLVTPGEAPAAVGRSGSDQSPWGQPTR